LRIQQQGKPADDEQGEEKGSARQKPEAKGRRTSARGSHLRRSVTDRT
jgi:hypothetical protein